MDTPEWNTVTGHCALVAGVLNMKPCKMLIKHDPPNSYGDCARCCIAAILNMEPEFVPHFNHDNPDNEEFHRRIDIFLAALTLRLVVVPFCADSCADVMSVIERHNGGLYWLLGAQSPAAPHLVVCKGGEIVCDPAGYKPDEMRPEADGIVWAWFLSPCL